MQNQMHTHINFMPQSINFIFCFFNVIVLYKNVYRKGNILKNLVDLLYIAIYEKLYNV